MIDNRMGQVPWILLNLTGLRAAGGRSVAINLLRAWDGTAVSERLTVVGPEKVGYEKEVPERARWIPLSAWRSRGCARPWVDNVTLPNIIRRVKPTVVLTLSNFACRIPPSAPTVQALQVMWPYAMYEDDEIWSRVPHGRRVGKRLRRAYLKWTARRADVLIAQTSVARDRLLARLPIDRAVVIPTAISLPREADNCTIETLPGSGPLWLCVSRYYSHKNLETLIDVAEILKSRRRTSRILLTIESHQHAGAASMICDIEQRSLNSHISSVGEVDLDAVRGLYAGAFGVVFPTLLESYSQVLAEALGYGLPLVTSDRDFVHSVCREAPVYVDPLDAQAIADAMIRLEDDTEFRERHILAGLAWAKSQPSWHDTGQLYADLCMAMNDTADEGMPQEERLMTNASGE